jgi:hypothetical protein
MAYSSNSYFPKQTVSDAEKLSYDYGLKVGKAIEQEWFNNDRGLSRYQTNHNNFHNLRLYARGEQSIQKYKDELSINGDLSYLNLDWKPIPIISKFVDIVVNGISERLYNITATSQDPYGSQKRTQYMESVLKDIRSKTFNDAVKQNFNIDIYETDQESLPQTQEELDIHMQTSYKQSVEIAQEQGIKIIMEGNNYDLVKKQSYYDLVTIGIAAEKTSFTTSEGVTVDYVDPANLVYSFTESPYFDDIYYVGEVKTIPVNELAKQFPHLKETGTGADKIIPKDDSFNPPEEKEGGYSRLLRSIEVLYDGAMILGTNKLLRWEMARNMMRPKSDYTKVKMNYAVVAPRMYNGKIDSLVKRITGFADMIQLTHLKLQQVMSRMVPDGVYLDADGLAEVDLGNGTNYNPQEALNMFFQTGSVVGRSFTSEGDINPGKIPIQEITSGSGGNKMQALIANYNYYLQMIRDVTGLNEARDGSTPDPNALVGIQKLAAANSNTATRHILNAGMFLTSETAESISLRISDIIEYSPTKDAFINAIGAHNVATLQEISDLHLYDFGIFIDLLPDEEENAKLEANIQMALQQNSIDLEDAIDLRNIQNIKLANQLLKLRRKKKMERDQLAQQQNMQSQAQANMATQQRAAELEVQKQQAQTNMEAELVQIKAKIDAQKMQTEADLKKQLMDLEFQYNMRLKSLEVEGMKQREKEKEDRKDERTKIQATQQSEMIEQRNSGKPPKNFESAGNDILSGGFDLGSFEPS